MMHIFAKMLQDNLNSSTPQPELDQDFARQYLLAYDEVKRAATVFPMQRGLSRPAMRILVLLAPTEVDECAIYGATIPIIEDLAELLHAKLDLYKPSGHSDAVQRIQQWSAAAQSPRTVNLLVYEGHGHDHGAWVWPVSGETTTYDQVKRTFLQSRSHNYIISDCCAAWNWAQMCPRVLTSSSEDHPDTVLATGLIMRLWWAFVMPATSPRARRARILSLRRIRNLPFLLEFFPHRIKRPSL